MNQQFFTTAEMSRYMQNKYWYFANTLFGYICAYYSSTDIFGYLLDIFRRYMVGITLNDEVVYWQCDANLRCDTAKVERYNSNAQSLGTRWIHACSQNNATKHRYPFGLHLFARHSRKYTVVVVESEKSALMGAAYNLLYFRNDTRLPLFIATGSVDLETTLNYLHQYKVTLMPGDKNADEWLRIAQCHVSKGNDIEVNMMVRRFVEKGLISPGSEYGDLLGATRRAECRARRMKLSENRDEN